MRTHCTPRWPYRHPQWHLVSPGGPPTTKHAFAAWVLVAATLLTTSACNAPRDPLRPHPHSVIILDLDTVRADHLGLYGYHRDTTPWLDQFAADAAVFEQAYSQAPNTPPSQASILTSRYPSSHGMIFDDDRVPASAVTMAEAFRNAGYATAAFVDGGYMSPNFGFDQGFDLYDNNKGKGLATIAPKAVDWVRNQIEALPEQPFFLLLHTYDAHTPYAPPEPHRSMFTEGLEAPSPGFEPDAQHLEDIRKAMWTDPTAGLSRADLAFTVARYDGGLRFVDDWVNAFLTNMRQMGVLDRATVVVLSDHGEEFQEHGSVLHEKLYGTVTHVPLIVRPPGGMPGLRLAPMVETIDVMPTLLAMTDTPAPDGLQGRSLVPMLRGEPSGPHRAISESPFYGHRRALGRDGFRALWTKSTDAIELYDLRVDRLEQRNLASEQPERATRMRDQLTRWDAGITRTRISDEANQGADAVDPETLEQLRALGYVD